MVALGNLLFEPDPEPEQTEVNQPYISHGPKGPLHFTMKFTRAQLEKLVDDLIQKTVPPCVAALKDAKVGPRARSLFLFACDSFWMAWMW